MSIKISQTMQSEAASAGSLADSFAEIRRLAKEATAENRLKLTLVLDSDIYRLTEPLTLSTEEEPGLAFVDLTIQSRVDGVRSAISGARAIPGRNFVKVEGKPYYKYQFEKDEKGEYPKFRELIVNGEHIPMARGEHLYRGEEMFYQFDYPLNEKKDPNARVKGAYLPVEALKRLTSDSISGAELQFDHCVTWNIFHIKKVNFKETRELGGKTYALVEFMKEAADYFLNKLKARLPMMGCPMHFVNAPAYLVPGTFTYDYYNGTLLYYPIRESDMTLPIEYPVAERLLVVHGMENLTLDRIKFTGTTCRFACEHPYRGFQAYYHVNDDVNDKRADQAALYATETRGLTVKNCVFEQLGAHGIRMPDHHVRVRMNGNIFKNIGMSAIFIGNLTSNTEYKNRLYDVRIENNYLEHISCEYAVGGAITVAKADGLSICHNTLREMGYMGIHMGWVWDPVYYCLGEAFNIRDAEIAYNYIEDYVLTLEDGGAIYALGATAHHDFAKRFNSMHDNYATAKVRLIWGRYAYYMDATCTNWDCYHNVAFNADHSAYSQECPWACSWHNHVHGNFFDTAASDKTLAPDRDVLFYDNVVDAISEEEFLAKYPEAKAIRDAAGCSAELLRAAELLHGGAVKAGAKLPIYTRMPHVAKN